MPKIKLINKCSMTLNIYDEAGETLLLTLESEGEPALIGVTGISLPPINGLIPVSTTEYGEASELPPFDPNTMYIVSLLYKGHAPRADLLSPGSLLRHPDGTPYGCRGLVK